MFHPLLIQEDKGLSEARLRRLVVQIAKLNKPATVNGLVSELEGYVRECLATPAAALGLLGLLGLCDIEALWYEPRFRRLPFWHNAALIVMLAHLPPPLSNVCFQCLKQSLVTSKVADCTTINLGQC